MRLLVRVALLVPAMVLRAEPIEYTSQYIPEVPPTKTTGTQADPVWYFQTHEGCVATVSDGVLTASNFDAVDQAARLQFWQVGMDGEREFGRPAEAWTEGSQDGITIDFTVRVTDGRSDNKAESGVPGGFELLVANQGYGINLYFDKQGITAWGAKVATDDVHENTSYGTYRLVIQGGRASLYEAGNESAIFSDLTMRSGAESFNVIAFGTITSTISGAWDLAFLGWNSRKAELTAPPQMKIPPQ